MEKMCNVLRSYRIDEGFTINGKKILIANTEAPFLLSTRFVPYARIPPDGKLSGKQ